MLGILFSFNQVVNAVPIFGLASQGTLIVNNGIVTCTPGWKWCCARKFDMANPILKDNLMSFEVMNGAVEVQVEEAYFKKQFVKLIKGNTVEISENVVLDSKITAELAKRLNKSGKGLLSLKKGKYNIKVVKGIVTILNIAADYVGHVTLLK